MRKLIKNPYKWLASLLFIGGLSGLTLTFLFLFMAAFGADWQNNDNAFGWVISLSYRMFFYYLFNSILVIISAILFIKKQRFGILIFIIVSVSVLMSLFLPSPAPDPNIFLGDSLFVWTTVSGYYFSPALFLFNFLHTLDSLNLLQVQILSYLTGSPLFLGSILINLIFLPYWFRVLERSK